MFVILFGINYHYLICTMLLILGLSTGGYSLVFDGIKRITPINSQGYINGVHEYDDHAIRWPLTSTFYWLPTG